MRQTLIAKAIIIMCKIKSKLLMKKIHGANI